MQCLLSISMKSVYPLNCLDVQNKGNQRRSNLVCTGDRKTNSSGYAWKQKLICFHLEKYAIATIKVFLTWRSPFKHFRHSFAPGEHFLFDLRTIIHQKHLLIFQLNCSYRNIKKEKGMKMLKLTKKRFTSFTGNEKLTDQVKSLHCLLDKSAK